MEHFSGFHVMEICDMEIILNIPFVGFLPFFFFFKPLKQRTIKKNRLMGKED